MTTEPFIGACPNLNAAGGRVYGPGGAAHRLGLNPTTLYGKMRKHGIDKSGTNWGEHDSRGE